MRYWRKQTVYKMGIHLKAAIRSNGGCFSLLCNSSKGDKR
jgi:hypothetical protein